MGPSSASEEERKRAEKSLEDYVEHKNDPEYRDKHYPDISTEFVSPPVDALLADFVMNRVSLNEIVERLRQLDDEETRTFLQLLQEKLEGSEKTPA